MFGLFVSGDLSWILWFLLKNFKEVVYWVQFAITCFQTNTIPEPIPAICLGCFRRHGNFFVKPNYLWYFLETQCWGVKRRGTCPLPSVPRGYQISWYWVNPIIGQVTKKINLNSPLDTFNTMKRFDFFYTFDSFGRCLQIHKNGWYTMLIFYIFFSYLKIFYIPILHF